MPFDHGQRISDYYYWFSFFRFVLIEWKHVFIRPELWICLFKFTLAPQNVPIFFFLPQFVNAMITSEIIHSNILNYNYVFWAVQIANRKVQARKRDWICLPSDITISSHWNSYGKIQCCWMEGGVHCISIIISSLAKG